MFKKIMIANRGEIACRVIRTARTMGIETLAVYSQADAHALHVKLANDAVCIGPSPAAKSYLLIDRLIDVCRDHDVDAVHPGYGFVSENPLFAKALYDADITFIGPSVHAMEVMGDKITAKRFASEAGINTVPGYADVISSVDEAIRIAHDIGYPIMIKAAAGGGGKGMRIANSDGQVHEGFQSATNEARASFADERVFIEKFITEPRHIEIQILADTHGNVIHLGERECSIQRRNQKVVEEAPSVFVDNKLRAEMGAQACALARAVGYQSAGTVEFITDPAGGFYFLEMNTRLQVEHTVTELITGLDLVEEMIRISYGEQLRFNQGDVTYSGWAIEARVYAEDPARNFLPSIGRLVRYSPPVEETKNGLTVRNDTGVEEGSTITVHYDPLIAKLCTHAPTRAEAIAHMGHALDRFTITGLEQNLLFLSALMAHPRWLDGRLNTNFIADEFPDGFSGLLIDDDSSKQLCVIAVLINRRQQLCRLGEDQINQASENRVIARINEQVFDIIIRTHNNQLLVLMDGKTHDISSNWMPGNLHIEAMINGDQITAQVRPQSGGVTIAHKGKHAFVQIFTARESDFISLMPEKASADTSHKLLCPMPGTVVSISVFENQGIKVGDALCVVEAMKMENTLRAERNTSISRILVEPGDNLAVDQVIMEFEDLLLE
jgi:propionyl-CoA carboxylase alpha chain